MANELTAYIRANLEYRLFQESGPALIEDVARITHNCFLPSGTGEGQVNQLWRITDAVHSVSGIASYNLSTLTFTRLNQQSTATFVGAGGGFLNGYRIRNDSINNLYARLPHNDGHFFTIPPSGDMIGSNRSGWPITTGDLLEISGNGSVQTYSVVLLGSARGMVVKAPFSIPLEFSGSLSGTQPLNLEYTMNMSGSNILPLEYVIGASSTGLSCPLEFTGGISGVASPSGINIEYKGKFDDSYDINYEYIYPSGSGGGLPKNKYFVEWMDIDEVENSNTQPFGNWEIAWTGTAYEDLDGGVYYNRPTVFTDSFKRLEIHDGPFFYIGDNSPNPVRIIQTFPTVPSGLYRFTCNQLSGFDMEYYQGDFGTIQFTDNSGNVLTTLTQIAGDNVIDGQFITPQPLTRMIIDLPARDNWHIHDNENEINKRKNTFILRNLTITRLA